MAEKLNLHFLTMLTTDSFYPPGTTLNDRFNILSLVNQGAQAVIFKATDMKSGDMVALKLVSDQHANYISSVERLKGEFDVLTALDGLDMFLKPYGLEVNTHEAYIAMEWLENSTDGNAFIRQHVPMDFKTWLWIAKSISMAVSLCHQRKIIHRDLKPGNILFAPQGVIKLFDFGISQNNRVINITDSDIQMGTVLYLPPELVSDGEYGISGEMFALGVTLYEFLCGEVPFHGDSPGEIIQKKLTGTFDAPSSINPDIPPWVDSFFSRLLAPSPQNRFQGVRELLSHLSIKKSAPMDDEIITFHRCESCREPLWKELSFCSHCGAIYNINAVAGSHGLIAKSVDNPDQFLKLFNMYTNNRLPGWRAHLFKSSYPRIMLAGVSEYSAFMIAEALTNENSSIQISSKPYIDALQQIKLSLPQALLAGLTIYLLFAGIFGVYGFSSKFFGMIIVCLSAIVFTGTYAMMPLVSIDTVSNLVKHREWKSLSEMREILSKISNKQIRQKASALIRRSVLLFDGIHAFNLAPSRKAAVIKNLDKLSLAALDRLVLMNQRLDSLLKYRKQGIDKKIKSLDSVLQSTKDQQIRKKVIDRIGELTNLKNEQVDIEKQYADHEVEYSNILSGLNSMYLYLINKDIEQLQNEMSRF